MKAGLSMHSYRLRQAFILARAGTEHRKRLALEITDIERRRMGSSVIIDDSNWLANGTKLRGRLKLQTLLRFSVCKLFPCGVWVARGHRKLLVFVRQVR